MADTIKNPITIAVKEIAEKIEADTTLSAALTTEGDTLTVFTGWPADGDFAEPSVTVLAPSTRLVRHFPVEKPWSLATDGAKSGALRGSRHRIGELQIFMDLHIYTNSLRQRGIVEGALFNIVEANTELDSFPHTLRIQSSDYYGSWIRYQLKTDLWRDGEENQTQSQYISVLSLECDMDWIVSRQEYEIASIHLHTQASTEALLTQSVNEEILIVS